MEVTLVHISDLHIGNDTKSRSRLEELREDLAKLTLGKEVITLLTGDLTQSGDEQQYEVLFDFLLGPLIELGHEIAVVPGNHDIQRELTSESQARDFLSDAGSSYLFDGHAVRPTPFSDNSNGPLTNYMALEDIFEPYIKRNFYGYVKQFGNLSVVGMNSAWLSHARKEEDTDRGKLRVEPHVLKKFAEHLPKKSFRVLLQHHPIDWLDDNTRRDVINLAAIHFDLVLFGHVHEADITSLVRRENGVSMIQSPPLRADWSKGTNGYSIIRNDIDSKMSEITYRSYSESRREFVPGVDFGRNGVCYPTKADAEHFRNSPSLSSLAQNYLAETPDYVDWYRRNIRAKSNNKESFVTPNIIRVSSSEEEQWFERPIKLSTLFNPTSRDQFVIAPADSGLSTSAFLVMKGRSELVKQTGIIPVFFNAGTSRINKASIISSMTQKCLVRFTTSQMESLTNEGAVSLIVDGLNLSDAEKFNNFRDVMKKHFPRVKIIAFVRTEKVGQAISGVDHPKLSVDDEIFKLGEFGVEQIRGVIDLHRKKVDGETASKLATQAVEYLTQINEPIFPSTAAVLVETLIQDNGFRPINKARLYDRFVECLLGRFSLGDVQEGNFTSYDKIDLLSFVARRLLERDRPGLNNDEWQSILKEYERRFMIELPRDLLVEFEEKGLVVSENGYITFRADDLFSYFIARQMKSDTEFAKKIIADDNLYKYHSEVIFYGGLEGTDTAAMLNEICSKLDQVEQALQKQYSGEGIDLETEWIEAIRENPESSANLARDLMSIEDREPDPRELDYRDNQKLANVIRRRGIARRTEVVELEARLLVTMKLYGQLIRNALHISGSEKLKHLKMLYRAAETWVGFMSASRAHIAARPVAIEGGVIFINYGAITDPKRSIAEFKYNAPNSISRVLAEALRYSRLSVALRNVLPDLSPMGALFAREALLGLASAENRKAYIRDIKGVRPNNSIIDKTLLHASLRTLRHQYLEGAKDESVREHTAAIVDEIRAAIGEKVIGSKDRLEKQRLLRDLKTRKKATSGSGNET